MYNHATRGCRKLLKITKTRRVSLRTGETHDEQKNRSYLPL
nr:MAG TPA: hypothetical protein [Microviridae sp.]